MTNRIDANHMQTGNKEILYGGKRDSWTDPNYFPILHCESTRLFRESFYQEHHNESYVLNRLIAYKCEE